jgi:hypothetical protein
MTETTGYAGVDNRGIAGVSMTGFFSVWGHWIVVRGGVAAPWKLTLVVGGPPSARMNDFPEKRAGK